MRVRLTLAAAAILTIVVSARALSLSQPTSSSQPEYAGSQACQTCHAAAYKDWESALHLRMTKPVAEATLVGDFAEATHFADHGRAYEFGRKDGEPFVKIAFGERAPETFAIDYTLGFKRYQGYLSTLPDGRIYVLPAFWQVDTKRWLDWKELAPVPDGAHGLRQIWNVNCFNCHATNLSQGYNVASTKYETKWTEMGIGCEGCHGPSRQHVVLMESYKKDPTGKPPFDIKTFSPRRSTPREVFDMCAYCHGNKTNVFTGFTPGSRYEDFALPFLISAPIPENDLQGEFWPDGRPNRFNRPQAVMQSGCFESGQLACTNCHVAHGSPNPFSLKVNISEGRNGDTLCTQCHSNGRAAVVSRRFDSEAHTFHEPDSPGSRCINCHMSDVNWRLLIRRRDHTYKPPVPELTAAYGIPNACTTCHDHRSPEWAAKQMDAWWGDGARRKAEMSVAETMYKAGAGDMSVAPTLAALTVDRSKNAFIRASAAEFLSNFMMARSGVALPGHGAEQSQTSFYGSSAARAATPASFGERLEVTPAIINALIGAASDPAAIVRAAAVRGLGSVSDQERVMSPLTARLIDPARVVRARTAEVLLAFGVSHLPDAAGTALLRAQEDYAVSLRNFPDSAVNHAALAWLEAQRGRLPEALAAADEALRVNPRYARPWVVKGVILARQQKYREAVEAWKKARSLEPSYPNIDQLISEAERLRKD